MYVSTIFYTLAFLTFKRRQGFSFKGVNVCACVRVCVCACVRVCVCVNVTDSFSTTFPLHV